jgi:hypothetical protein
MKHSATSSWPTPLPNWGLADALIWTGEAERAMPILVCVTCGTQFAETGEPPKKCEVSENERQYVGCGS